MKALNVKKMGGTGQSGFTIIELVVVILLLGILTATALPRFMNVTDQAHDAVVNATLSGIGTGLALFRAQWIAEGEPTALAGGDFATGDAVSGANSVGYPTGEDDDTAPSAHADCVNIFDGLLQQANAVSVIATDHGAVATALQGNAGDGVGAGNEFVAVYVGAATPTCEYYYTGQFSANGQTVPVLIYTPSAGSINLHTAEIALAVTTP